MVYHLDLILYDKWRICSFKNGVKIKATFSRSASSRSTTLYNDIKP